MRLNNTEQSEIEITISDLKIPPLMLKSLGECHAVTELYLNKSKKSGRFEWLIPSPIIPASAILLCGLFF